MARVAPIISFRPMHVILNNINSVIVSHMLVFNIISDFEKDITIHDLLFRIACHWSARDDSFTC